MTRGTYLFHEFVLSMLFARIRFWHDVGPSVIVLVVTISFCQLPRVYFEKPLVKINHRTKYEFGAWPRRAARAGNGGGDKRMDSR
jgi:peptidoglycan/LPS O-acetylase OafA/YrhL